MTVFAAVQRVVTIFFIVAIILLIVALARADEKVFVTTEAGGTLYRVYPAGGSEKDSILFLELNGNPYELGYQHGVLLANRIADVISYRYSCDAITPEVLAWMGAAYEKIPPDFREEIRGLSDGLAAKGYDFPFAKVAMHATQPITPSYFPWFTCPWEEGTGPTGSFSYAVWGSYVAAGGSLHIGSPDWGPVPQSLARNRVIFSIRPTAGYRHVFLGVAGTIGLTGVNETGLATGGTTGQRAAQLVTPMPGNGLPIPDGFMSLFMISRRVLQNFSGFDPLLFERFESEILKGSPVDMFITHLSAPGRSALWEPGATASPSYPYNSRRQAGEWDNDSILPIDVRGDLILTRSGVFRASEVSYQVSAADNLGVPYSGTAELDGKQVKWRRWHLGRAFVLPKDASRTARFAEWYANLDSRVAKPTPLVTSADVAESVTQLVGTVSLAADRTGGYWASGDGLSWGWWRREGNGFRAFSSDGSELCSGPLYDFGGGMTGWCNVGDSDIEWVAWTMKWPAGAYERLDGMNLSVLPAVKPWAKVRAYGHYFFDQGPHSRTHFALRYLGEPKGTLTPESLYEVFQKAYLAAGQADAPFGVQTYDLVNLEGLFTASRYEGGRYIGGLNPEQKPIRLNAYQLFYQ